MYIHSNVEKKKYLRELRYQMESWFSFGEPRFTGVILGNFFYVTHHAGHECNHRITNEKSRAFGFVTKEKNGCGVCAICTRGYLDPFSLVTLYLLLMVTVFLMITMNTMEVINPFAIPAVCWGLAFSVFFVGVISYVQCWFTERGQESMRELQKLLQNPVRIWEEEE